MFANARAVLSTAAAVVTALCLTVSGLRAQPALPSPATRASFTNPIVPAQGKGGSADPSVVYFGGAYYYCRSLGGSAIGIARATRLQDIGSVPMRTVWTAAPGTAHSRQVWAPELQHLRGRWYVYFAASDGDNANHRMYALRSVSDDPQSAYEFEGKIAAKDSDEWAIDGLTLQDHGSLYFVWSGWRHAGEGFPQVTYIARMSDPLTIGGERHEIAAPELAWEREGAPLMEGQEVLRHGGRVFIVYSASGSWTDDYKLGMLSFKGGDILDRTSWTKSQVPVFSKLANGGVFGPGHNAFVKSPDGKEDWIVYHAIDTSGGGWARRSVRAQPFGWRADGTPDFGAPVALGVPVAEPSGTPALGQPGDASPVALGDEPD